MTTHHYTTWSHSVDEGPAHDLHECADRGCPQPTTEYYNGQPGSAYGSTNEYAADVRATLLEYVETVLASELMEAGRRPGPSKSAAKILGPVVLRLLADPLVAKSAPVLAGERDG